MATSFPERDWKLLRGLSSDALNRYCERALNECAAIATSKRGSPHERYLELFRALREHDQRIAIAFDDLKRSSAVQRLGTMLRIGAITEADVSEFTDQTRAEAAVWAGLEGTRPRR